jgi:DNA (cytosine-5)-methyltransferase 1
MIMAEKEFYTIEEVAKRLRVSTETVRKLIASGSLQSYKVGRQYRIPVQAIDDYLNRSK